MDNKPGKREIREAVGGLVSFLGKLSLPFGVGIIVGFYFADQEMRFVPTVLEISLILFVFGFVSVPLGRLLQGKAFHITGLERRIRLRVVLFGVLASLAVIGRLFLFWTEAPSALTELTEDEFRTAFQIDSTRYRQLGTTLERAVTFLEKSEGVFDTSAPKVLTPDQERDVLSAWNTVLDSAFSLDQIRVFFEDWYRFDISRVERHLLISSFLLSFASEVNLYEKSLRVVDRIEDNPHAVKFLDAPHPDLGIEEQSFSRFRGEMLGARDEAMVAAGKQYLRFLETSLRGEEEANSLGVSWLWNDIEEGLLAIEDRGSLDKATLGAEADFQAIKRVTRRNWFVAQKSMADWMGDTRVRRIGTYLVKEEQQEAMDEKLAPGDILLSRKNWYLSNVGLPGFWPHAILYLGDPAKFVAYFDTVEVRGYIEELSGKDQSLGDYLAATVPGAWKRYMGGDHGDSYQVVEAVSEGVVFNTLAHCSGDYVAAVRPALDKKAKAQAIIEAFGHVGKPYDFDFDFATDHALVCTELVWRSYRPAEGKTGIEFPLAAILGRKTLPANDIAKAFATTIETEHPELKFVYFLDANEKEGRAFVSTEQEFAKTHLRTKWDLALP